MTVIHLEAADAFFKKVIVKLSVKSTFVVFCGIKGLNPNCSITERALENIMAFTLSVTMEPPPNLSSPVT